MISQIRQCLFPLRIYTALKQYCSYSDIVRVCFPYEFTLLSNVDEHSLDCLFVCFPYEFTLLSNCDSFLVAPPLCLFPLRIYTALKLSFLFKPVLNSLFPLRIYTALKPQIIQEKYLRNICVTFIVYWKHFYFNIKYIDLHPL